MKWLMVVALVGIVGALGAAGVAMLKRGETPGAPRSHRMMQALALRVALSVALFAAILLAYLLGWIQPTGLPQG